RLKILVLSAAQVRLDKKAGVSLETFKTMSRHEDFKKLVFSLAPEQLRQCCRSIEALAEFLRSKEIAADEAISEGVPAAARGARSADDFISNLKGIESYQLVQGVVAKYESWLGRQFRRKDVIGQEQQLIRLYEHMELAARGPPGGWTHVYLKTILKDIRPDFHDAALKLYDKQAQPEWQAYSQQQKVDFLHSLAANYGLNQKEWYQLNKALDPAVTEATLAPMKDGGKQDLVADAIKPLENLTQKDEVVKEMVCLHSKLREKVKKNMIGAGRKEPYEFSLRDLRAWSNYVREFSPRLGLARSFVKGAMYVYRDRMEKPEDRKEFMKTMSELNLGSFIDVAASDEFDQIVEFKGFDERDILFSNNLDVLFRYFVRGQTEDLAGAIRESSGMLSDKVDMTTVAAIYAWKGLPPEIAQQLIDHTITYEDGPIKRAIIDLVNQFRFKKYATYLMTLLDRKDRFVAASAARALITLGYKKVDGRLLKDVAAEVDLNAPVLPEDLQKKSDEVAAVFAKYHPQMKQCFESVRSRKHFNERDANNRILPPKEGYVQVGCAKVMINEQGGPYVPSADVAHLVHTASTVSNLEAIGQAVTLNDPILLIGETGVGKTSLVRYLAYLSNNNFRRFNLNGQTDKLEFIGGRRPQADGTLKWVDGILIESMKNGYWLLLDEINLAEPQIIERINSLLDDDRNIILREHDGEKIVPHPNFRLFATMNPVEYAGRQALSPALMNRFRVKWIEELSERELLNLVRRKFGFDEDVIARVIMLHQNLRSIAPTLGKNEPEPYYFTVRHLLRIAKRVKARTNNNFEFGPLVMKLFAQEACDIYGSMLRSKEDQQVFKEQMQQVFPGVDCYSCPVSDEELDTSGIEHVQGPYVPGEEAKLVHVKSTLCYARKIIKAVRQNERILLVGPTASSKTSVIRYLAHLTGNNFVRVSLDGQTDTCELIGEYIPGENAAERSYLWRDGVLIEAMKKGYWILLDEMNLAEPQILERINSLIDDDGFIVVTEHEGEMVRPHANFRLFAAMNPTRYSGRNKISPALRNKFHEIWMDGEFTDEELTSIIRHYLGSFAADDVIAEMIKIYKHVQKRIQEGQIGRRKMGNDGYSFSLRDVKQWAYFIKTFNENFNADMRTTFLKGAMYVFKDRLESPQDKEQLKEIVKESKFASTGSKSRDFDIDVVWEEQTYETYDIMSMADFVQEEDFTSLSLADQFRRATENFPQDLQPYLKQIAQMLASREDAKIAEGIRIFVLLPREIATVLLDVPLASKVTQIKKAAIEVIGDLRLRAFSEKLRNELLMGLNPALSAAVTVALQKLENESDSVDAAHIAVGPL
ncbi:MAG TPA: AAA family ATPase, partial [Candidatus Omnitrophota bacterium]|nr:AAA family ATPase [Candidatus Omnitrophota bacterium]